MKTVTALAGQTLIDIAVQELGDASRVSELSTINDLGITDDLTAGQVVLVPEVEKGKQAIVRLFTDKAFAPASAITEGGEAFSTDEGIDFWAIENDFEVQ